MMYGANANGTGAGPHQARRINGVTQTYDANGNLTSGMARTIAWNNENLPSSVTSNSVTETYGYNIELLSRPASDGLPGGGVWRSLKL
jgi:hypothetical protein